MYAKQFGIDKSEGIVKTFFSNDWIHSIFINQYASKTSQKIAQALITSQITFSAIALAYFQGSEVCTVK